MKGVVIRLTAREAELVWKNADGWIDAGACADGLRPDEAAALSRLNDQISAQIFLNKGKRKSKAEPMGDQNVPLRARLEKALANNTMWDLHGDMLTDILDEVMKVLETENSDVEVA
jgi:hypothetical protein